MQRVFPASTTGRRNQKRLGWTMSCCERKCRQLLNPKPKFDLHEPLRLLEHGRELGADGIQVRQGSLAAAKRLRDAAEKTGLFSAAIVSVPTEPSMFETFDTERHTATAVGP